MLACRLGRLLTRVVNFADGIDGSMVRRHLPVAVEVKSDLILRLRSLPRCCSSTALLKGRGFGFPLHFSAVGSWLGGLEEPVVAFLASASMASLPEMLACPGTHQMLRWGSPCLSSVLSKSARKISVIECPEWANVAMEDWMAAWLSTPMYTNRTRGFFNKRVSPNSMPTCSPLYTVKCQSLPKWKWRDLSSLPLLLRRAAVPMLPWKPDPSVKICTSSVAFSASAMASSLSSAMEVCTLGVQSGGWQRGQISSTDLGWMLKTLAR